LKKKNQKAKQQKNLRGRREGAVSSIKREDRIIFSFRIMEDASKATTPRGRKQRGERILLP